MSHPTPGPGANSDTYHFGPSTEDEMEADLKRIDAMEEDQEVTSRLQAEFTMGELPSLAVPASVIPSNSRFLSYENMKKEFHVFSRSYAASLGKRSFGHYGQAP